MFIRQSYDPRNWPITLLSASHVNGRHKALFFESVGFSSKQCDQLAVALRDHALENAVSGYKPSRYGMRYVIDGPLRCPADRTALVRAVWFVEKGDVIPYFVTAYPG